jgi:succinate dehydrogenase / fumarate reductase cytochrome b subunit
VKAKRPVNLDIGTINLPLAALTSITHRITGVALFAGLSVLLYLLNHSLVSEDDFLRVREIFATTSAKLTLWVILSALGYHLVAGCKHLLMDLGIGESKAAGPTGAKITIVLSAVVSLIMGVWLW